MAPRILEGLIGAVLVALTLRDFFTTVVVPGESRGVLRLSRRFIFLGLPVWRRVGRRRGVPVSFAPVVLMASFVSWMLLLTLSFGMMIHSLRDSFRPPIDGFGHALYVAGTSLATIGFGAADPVGVARGVIVAAGFCGLAVMTLAVTYILEVRQGLAQRDAGILKLTTTAGQPPSALALMERYAELDCRHELTRLLRDGRDWCASVHESHTEHPSLIYFRSVGAGSGWPAALGALMDLSLIIEFMLDAAESRAPAVLLRDEGNRMLVRLREQIGLQPLTRGLAAADVDLLRRRLRLAGFAMRDPFDRAAFMRARGRHADTIAALAGHLGTREAPLIAERE
jgi:hypothetical protein